MNTASLIALVIFGLAGCSNESPTVTWNECEQLLGLDSQNAIIARSKIENYMAGHSEKSAIDMLECAGFEQRPIRGDDFHYVYVKDSYEEYGTNPLYVHVYKNEDGSVRVDAAIKK